MSVVGNTKIAREIEMVSNKLILHLFFPNQAACEAREEKHSRKSEGRSSRPWWAHQPVHPDGDERDLDKATLSLLVSAMHRFN